MDWLDRLAVQGILKSLLQHHSSKASILHCSAFFIVQLSHPYMITGKTITLKRQTFAGKVMFLIFNMLSKFVITLGEVIGSIEGTSPQLLCKKVFSLKAKKTGIYGTCDLFLLVYQRGLVGGWYYNQVHLGAGQGVGVCVGHSSPSDRLY